MNTQQDSPYTQNTICIQLCCLSGHPLWQVYIPKYLLSYPLQTPNCTYTPILTIYHSWAQLPLIR